MEGSLKAKLLVFLIVAVVAFCVSQALITFTIHEDNDSYKLISLNDDSFEPNNIDYVPTHIPKNDTNTTNSTNDTDIIDDIDDTIDNWTDEWTENSEEE